jgi:hypothetical protein
MAYNPRQISFLEVAGIATTIYQRGRARRLVYSILG